MENSQKSSQPETQGSSQESSSEQPGIRLPLSPPWISEELIEMATKVNKESLAQVDKEVLAGFRRDQVELLGGDEDFYDKVDASLKKLKVVEEIKDAQQKLYEWRENFFVGNFNSKVDWAVTWITWGGDSTHLEETIPYQIACKFDKLMKLASTKRVLAPNECFYFRSHMDISYQAEKCFDAETRKIREEDGRLDSDDEVDSDDSALVDSEEDCALDSDEDGALDSDEDGAFAFDEGGALDVDEDGALDSEEDGALDFHEDGRMDGA